MPWLTFPQCLCFYNINKIFIFENFSVAFVCLAILFMTKIMTPFKERNYISLNLKKGSWNS